MNHELIFSLAGILAMAGWVLLLLLPLVPIWSERIAGLAIPVVLSAGYGIMIFAFPPPTGGFRSFAGVTELFSHANALIAGWVHYLAFDLLVGAWICRQGRRDDMAFWLVAPCLPVTLLFGPAGYLMFQIVRCVRRAAFGFVRDL